MDWRSLPRHLTSRQEEVKTDIDAHSDHIVALKTSWNATVPAGRLPAELLLFIFEDWAARCFNDARPQPNPDYKYSYGKKPPLLYPGGAYSWTVCAHVCRQWREVAFSSPRLWRRVVPGSPTWTKLVLKQSANYMLYVDFTAVKEPDPVALERLRQRFHRICEARLTDDDLEHIDEEHHAHALRALYVSHVKDSKDFFQDMPFYHQSARVRLFATDGLPSLSLLEIRKISPALAWNLFRPTLQVLKIVGLRPVPALSSLLRALAGMPNLRELEVTTTKRCGWREPWTPKGEYRGLPGSVVLPHLYRLVLCDRLDGKWAQGILEQLELPAIENMELSFFDLPYNAVPETLLALLQRVIPALPAGFRLEELDAEVRFRASINMSLSGSGTAVTKPSLRLSFTSGLVNDPLRILLEALPHIRTLHIRGDGPFIPRLLKQLRPPSSQTGDHPAPENPVTLFPHLRLVRMYDVDWEDCGRYYSDREETRDDGMEKEEIIRMAELCIRERNESGAVESCCLEFGEDRQRKVWKKQKKV